MSERYHSDWIEAFVRYTENSEPPTHFKRWVAISAIASCLERKVYLQWEGTLYPNLYIVLVGPSGCRKGTAMRPAKGLLQRVGIHLSPEAVTREQLIRRLRRAGESIPKERGEILMHASLTVFSEELTVFLGYNNQQLMADLCNWYDCPDPWTYETKNMGKDHIESVWVNMLGATTPRLLQTTLPQDAIGGGLTSRIIFVYASKKGKKVLTPFMTAEEAELEEELYHDLEMIWGMQGEFVPDESYIEAWIDWYSVQDETPPFHDPRLAGYLERRAVHTLKLSMVANASRGGDMTLTAEDLHTALRYLTSIEPMMPMVFRGIGKSELAEITSAVMTTVSTYKRIHFNELLGLHYYDADRDMLLKVCNSLTAFTKNGKHHYQWHNRDPMTRIIEVVEGTDGAPGSVQYREPDPTSSSEGPSSNGEGNTGGGGQDSSSPPNGSDDTSSDDDA